MCENFNISTNYTVSVEAANLILHYCTPIATHYCSLPLYTQKDHTQKLYLSRVVFPIPCKIELVSCKWNRIPGRYPPGISQEKKIKYLFIFCQCVTFGNGGGASKGIFYRYPNFKLRKVGKVGSKHRMRIPSRIWIGYFLQVPQFKLQKVGKVGSKDRMQISSQNWIEYFLQVP